MGAEVMIRRNLWHNTLFAFNIGSGKFVWACVCHYACVARCNGFNNSPNTGEKREGENEKNNIRNTATSKNSHSKYGHKIDTYWRFFFWPIQLVTYGRWHTCRKSTHYLSEILFVSIASPEFCFRDTSDSHSVWNMRSHSNWSIWQLLSNFSDRLLRSAHKFARDSSIPLSGPTRPRNWLLKSI